MSDVYIAINGDDVGTTIGQAIAADDHEGVQSTSQAVKDAHGTIAEWVEQQGGQEVTSSGDEGVYIVPEEALDQLEEITAQYEEGAGHTLTVGVGGSMSEASKALIYGKLNGKNQIVEYEPSIDRHLTDEDLSEVDDEAASVEDTPDELEDEQDPEKFDEDDRDQDTEEIEVPEKEVDGDYETEDMEEGQPQHEKEMTEEEEFVHDAQENRADEADDDAVEADEESQDEEYEEGYDEPNSEEDQLPQQDELESEETVYDDLTETDTDDQDMQEEIPEEAPEGEEDSYDYNDALTDMIQGHMEGDEDTAEEGMQEDEDGDLKQDIATALQAFKQNKDMLEQAQEQNPELYQATITMLRSMIDMARKLGYSPEEDMEAMETESDMEEQFPEAEYDAPHEAEGMEAGGAEEEVPTKKPKGRGQ